MKAFIDREVAIEFVKKAWAKGLNVVEYLEEVPAADVVPVVRCKDCKYCRRVDEFEYWCEGFCSPARLVRKDDFCSHGNLND